jgi:hypothetical protein
MLLAAFGLGVFSWGLRRARRQGPAVATLRELGSEIIYDYGGGYEREKRGRRAIQGNLSKPSPYPAWLVDRLGLDFFHDVVEVHCESSRKHSDEQVERFWQAIASLPQLTRLEASGGVTRPGKIQCLDRHDRLESLALRWADLAPEDYRVFHQLDRLAHLKLCETPVTDECLAHLAGHKTLRSLDLHHALITDDGLKHLAGLSQLERLWLSGTDITDEGVAHLRGHPSLIDLDLCHTEITDQALAHVASIPQLAELDVSITAVTDAGLANLERHPALAYLNLETTHVTGPGLASLKRVPNLRELCLVSPRRRLEISNLNGCWQLQRLKLGYLDQSPEEVAALQIPSVIEIGSGQSHVDDEMLLRFAKMPKLKAIHCYDMWVSPAAVIAFKQAQPDCELIQGSALTRRGFRSRP